MNKGHCYDNLYGVVTSETIDTQVNTKVEDRRFIAYKQLFLSGHNVSSLEDKFYGCLLHNMHLLIFLHIHVRMLANC